MKQDKIQFNWIPGLFLITYHLLLLGGLPLYLMYCEVSSWKLIVSSFVLMYMTGLSITMGYHRLYSHKTYKIHPIAESFLLFFGTMAAQGSVFRWSFDHRHHHAFVDTDKDPYSIKKGFWYAHFLWLFEKPKVIDKAVIADLAKRPVLAFQHRYYGLLFTLTNTIAFFAFGWFFQDYLGAFVFGVLARMFVLHHSTWFINSLAHTWGAHSFCKELSAVDNYIIALLTFGEGYHNYHHTFANDYRNGIRWYHFDPTKWLIWLLHKCRLARQLKTMQKHQIEARLLEERTRLLLEKIADSFASHKDEIEKKVSSVIENISVKLKTIKNLQDSYGLLKKQGKIDSLSAIKLEIKELKKSLACEYQKWFAVSSEIKRLTLEAS